MRLLSRRPRARQGAVLPRRRQRRPRLHRRPGRLSTSSGQLVLTASRSRPRRPSRTSRACLEAAGCGLDDVVKVNVYPRRPGDFEAFNAVYRRPSRSPIRRGQRCRQVCRDGSAWRSRRWRGSRTARDRARHAGRGGRRRPAPAQPRALAGALRHGRARKPPHVKTHKSVEIARRQVALGAHGVTCQKLGEAEVMVDAGITDVLVSYNVARGREARASRGARRASRDRRHGRRRAPAAGDRGCCAALARASRARRAATRGSAGRGRHAGGCGRAGGRGRRALTGSASAASSPTPRPMRRSRVSRRGGPARAPYGPGRRDRLGGWHARDVVVPASSVRR